MQSGGEGREEQGERERGRKEGGESWCGGNLTRCNTNYRINSTPSQRSCKAHNTITFQSHHLFRKIFGCHLLDPCLLIRTGQGAAPAWLRWTGQGRGKLAVGHGLKACRGRRASAMPILMHQMSPTRCMSASGGAVSPGPSTQLASTRTRAVSPGSPARVTATTDPVTRNHFVHSIHPRAAARADPKAPEKPPGTRRATPNHRA